MASNQATEVVDAEFASPHAIELMERAQIDIQIATARKYPRQLAQIKANMISMATLDEETAEQCFFTLKRGEKLISGPSVRLAEIATACYGHIRAGARIIDNDGRTVTAQGVCHDLQNNVVIAMETKRRITDKNGKTYNDDMQIMTGNAAAAIAYRNAVFKVIPAALIKPAYEAARKVAIGNAQTLKQRRANAVDKFKALGVELATLLAYLGKTHIDEIGLPELEVLIGVFNGIKDGESSVDETFAEAETRAKGTIERQKVQQIADYIARTENVSMDEALRLAEERWENPEKHDDRLKKQMDEQLRQAEAAEVASNQQGADQTTQTATGDSHQAESAQRPAAQKPVFGRRNSQ